MGRTNPHNLFCYHNLKPVTRSVCDCVGTRSRRLSYKRTYEERINKLARDLAFRFDADPLHKIDFIILFIAAREYKSVFRKFKSSETDALISECHHTYSTNADISYKTAFSKNTATHTIPVHRLKTLTYNDLFIMPRLERIMLQSSIILRSQRHMNLTYDRMLSACINQRSRRILNIGDGVSYHSSFLKRILDKLTWPAWTPQDIITVDMQPSIWQLQAEASNLKPQSSPQLLFRQMDATNMLFENHTFDLIVASFMIDDCHDHKHLLSEIRRVLRSGGICCISGHHADQALNAECLVYTMGDCHSNQSSLPDIKRICKLLDYETCDTYKNAHSWMLRLRKGNPEID